MNRLRPFIPRLFVFLSICVFASGYSAPILAPRQAATITRKAMLTGPDTNKIPVPKLSGLTPAPVSAQVIISWPLPAVLLKSTNLFNWKPTNVVATASITMPVGNDREFFRVSVPNQIASVQWNASTYAIGYRVYYGLTSSNYSTNVDAGGNLSYVIPNLSPGKRYFFAVQAYNDSGLSLFSNEINYVTPGTMILEIKKP